MFIFEGFLVDIYQIGYTLRMEHKKKVVIVGGGFAGIACARRLLKEDLNIVITVVSDREYLAYYPGLYSLVTEGKQKEVSIPLSDMLPRDRVHVVQAKMKGLNRSSQEIHIVDSMGETTIRYDFLVLALGSEAYYFNIPGLEERSFSFKSVDEALRLKAHFESVLSKAKSLSKDELIAALHIIIVGAGPSGVELAGTLKPYLTKRAIAHGVDKSFITIDLVEASSRVLSALPENVSVIAEQQLRKMGVNIFTNRTLTEGDEDEAIFSTMEIKTDTVVWAAGTRINSLYKTLDGIELTERNCVQVTQHMTLPDNNHIFIAGDGAATNFSGLAQTAMYDGEYVGYAIAQSLREKPFKAYVPKKPSFVIPIGKRWAIFVHGKIAISGVIISGLRKLIDWRYRFLVTQKFF